MYKTSYRLKAEDELAEAIEWYENKSEGLGKRFLKEVQKKVKEIQKQPDYFAIRQIPSGNTLKAMHLTKMDIDKFI